MNFLGILHPLNILRPLQIFDFILDPLDTTVTENQLSTLCYV